MNPEENSRTGRRGRQPGTDRRLVASCRSVDMWNACKENKLFRVGNAAHSRSRGVTRIENVQMMFMRSFPAKCGDEFTITHQTNLDAPIAATPAMDRNSIYIRADDALMAFR